MMARLILIAVLLLFAACSAENGDPPVEVTRQLGFRHQGLVGLEPVPVRVYFRTAATNTELTGVPCRVEGPGYAARFHSPAVVHIPDYGPDTPVPQVTCRFGDHSASVTPALYNRTEQDATAALATGAGGGPVLSYLVRAAYALRGDAGSDDFAFHPARVDFTR